MSQAQKKLEPFARARVTPPPLPRHSGIAPATSENAEELPPLAAIDFPVEPASSVVPILSARPPADLALAPLWDDANLPLRPASLPSPAPTPTPTRWLGRTTVSLAVGALVAAGLMTIRIGDYAQILPHGESEPVAHAQRPALTLAAAVAPLQVYEPEAPLEISLSELEALALTEPSAAPDLTAKPDAVAKPAKVAKSAKVVKSAKVAKSAKLVKKAKVSRSHRAPKQRSKRGKRGRTMPAVVHGPEPEAPVQAQASAPAPEPAAPVQAVAAAPALPQQLTRAQVKTGLEAVRSKVLSCTHGTYGRILADITISAPGKVSNAVIEGTFAGTKAGACMAQRISHAKFPAFSGPDITVHYPYSF